jgi:quercetin dioxygenase-like cupin family protein
MDIIKVLEITGIFLFVLLGGYLLGVRRDVENVPLAPEVVDEYNYLAKVLKEETRGDIKIVGEMEDGSPIEFDVRMHEWTYLGEKTRIKGIRNKWNSFQVYCEVHEDQLIIPHKHKDVSEGIKIIKGRARLVVGGEVVTLEPGDDHKIPKNTLHALEALPDEKGKVYAEYIAYWP